MFFLSLLVAGMALAVRIGDANSPMVACMTLPSSLFPSPTTTPTPSASTTPGTQEEEDSGDPRHYYQCIDTYHFYYR